jgi:hypothetical protein
MLEIIPIIVAIISTTGLLLVATYNYWLRHNQDRGIKRVRFLFGLFIALIVLSVISSIFLVTIGERGTEEITAKRTSEEPETAQPAVTPESKPIVFINYPTNGGQVSQVETISGTAQNIQEGKELWIVVKVLGRYHPQDDAVKPDINGNWSTEACIGVAGDKGARFDIMAVLADENASALFRDYLDRSKAKNSWEGLEGLPGGATVCDQLSVTRK